MIGVPFRGPRHRYSDTFPRSSQLISQTDQYQQDASFEFANGYTTSHLPASVGGPSNSESDALYDNEDLCTSENDDSEYVNTRAASAVNESPKSFGGIVTDVNCTNVIAVAKSRQNSELLYFCESSGQYRD